MQELRGRMNSLSEIYLERMKGKDAQRQEEVIYSRANMPGCHGAHLGLCTELGKPV